MRDHLLARDLRSRARASPGPGPCDACCALRAPPPPAGNPAAAAPRPAGPRGLPRAEDTLLSDTRRADWPVSSPVRTAAPPHFRAMCRAPGRSPTPLMRHADGTWIYPVAARECLPPHYRHPRREATRTFEHPRPPPPTPPPSRKRWPALADAFQYIHMQSRALTEIRCIRPAVVFVCQRSFMVMKEQRREWQKQKQQPQRHVPHAARSRSRRRSSQRWIPFRRQRDRGGESCPGDDP